MAIVKYKNQSGITYAYESISVWDPEKKQSRPKRKYLGRVDPETGEIIPTNGKRGRPPKKAVNGGTAQADAGGSQEEKDKNLSQAVMRIRELEEENRRLKEERKKLVEEIAAIDMAVKKIITDHPV